jgi:DNA recombination protein RmuC
MLMEILILILLILNICILLILLFKKNDGAQKNITDLFYKFEGSVKDEFLRNRQELNSNNTQGRTEVLNLFKNITDNIQSQMKNSAYMQKNQLDTFSNQLLNLTKSNEERLNKMRDTIEIKLEAIQNDNNKKLDEMRKTVDEKLHESLEKRLGESFAAITERLEKLYKEMGEIGSLASGVNELKRTLANVKVRGTYGEVQLQAILDDILTVDQYETNAATKRGSKDRVEFAIKIPSKNDLTSFIYLPIDSKFPQEDYQRLLDADEKGDKISIEEARKALINRIKSEAQDIKSKYLDPPQTTDFGILFLPTESLYAEAVKEPGLMECLQRDFRVVITGPSTVSAFLNSLQMGFRTLAIEKRSSEVWELLGVVKTEFGKFGDILEKTQKKLQEASNTIESASKKSRTIEKKLKSVGELPEYESKCLEESEDD